jgi:hypothetical protein
MKVTTVAGMTALYGMAQPLARYSKVDSVIRT